MALQRRVHDAVELAELRRVFADELRREFLQSGAHPRRVRGQVRGTERAHFAVPDQSAVGLDADDGAVEDIDELAAGPAVAPFDERQLDAMGEDALDLHRARLYPTGPKPITPER